MTVNVADQHVAPGAGRAELEPRTGKGRARRMTVLLMVGAVASKLLGFLREILMAQIIGVSLVGDAFRGALTAVLLPIAFLQNESVPAILIPMHIEAQKKGHAPEFLVSIAAALTLLALGPTIGILALGETWIDVIVGGFGEAGRALTLTFVRVMSLAMPAAILSSCLAGGEIASGVSRMTNIRASLINVSLILGLLTTALTGHVEALAWGFVVAFNFLAVWGAWKLSREGLLDVGGLAPKKVAAAGAQFLWRLRPLIALPFAEQGQVWVERLLASRIGVGAISSLDYARTLSDCAILLISQPVGLAFMASHNDGDKSARIESVFRTVLAIMAPASVFLFIFASDIVQLVFQRGAFNQTGVTLTSQALTGISMGLWASTLGWVLLRALNSDNRNAQATVIVISAYAANILLNLVTSCFQESLNLGLTGLGLGEAFRGLTLLAGTALALPNRRKLFMLILLAIPSACAMGYFGWRIHSAFDGAFLRLILGAAAYVPCALFAFVVFHPRAHALAEKLFGSRG
jgi:putative peptidoglycan lipid II flippase